MSKLPQVSGSDVIRALQKVGFSIRRQHGSHLILRRAEPFAQTVVPNHKQIDRGTLRAILRQTGLSLEEFVELLHS
jgi:predicted RNA binding protein YcfA (HicA-like mRNA interferase family)